MDTQLADILWRDRAVNVEYRWLRADDAQAPLIVFLHEGLGSISMWRDFPQRLCDALGSRGLVYSRPGYGRSSPRAPDDAWQPDFQQRQAVEVLPALLERLGVNSPYTLFGHSDGATIALLHAAAYPSRVDSAIVVAPHIMVEPLTVDSIAAARRAYVEGDLKARLARHHADVDSAFWGWNDIWLHPSFRHWSIEDEIGTITCPLLAMQGTNDEYGSLQQIRGIADKLPQTLLCELPGCGHSPHRDDPDAVIAATRAFLSRAPRAHQTKTVPLETSP